MSETGTIKGRQMMRRNLSKTPAFADGFLIFFDIGTNNEEKEEQDELVFVFMYPSHFIYRTG